MTRFPLFYSLLFLAACLFFPDTSAQANIHKKIKQEKAQQATLEKKAKSLSAEVSDLQKKLVRSAKNLRQSEDTYAKTARRLKTLQHKRAHYLETLHNDHAALGGLAAAARKYKSTSNAALLFQPSPLQAARAEMIMKSVTPHIQNKAETLRKRLQELGDIEEDIKISLTQQKEEKDRWTGEKTRLSGLIKKRKAIYKKTERSRTRQIKEVARLTKEAKTLSELVSKIQPARKPRTHKKMKTTHTAKLLPPASERPVRGRVLVNFGQKDEMGGTSKGLTYLTQKGATVITPLAGKVKFAGPFRKFKQILIVEHNGGYHSLIAGMGHIDTVVGATLAAGEPVGRAEAEEDAPRIYYELLKSGTPVNPKKMLTQRKQDHT